MNTNDITSMFEGVSEEWKEILARKLKRELCTAILQVNARVSDTGCTREHIAPPPNLIFNAFRLCPRDAVRVVLLGQDPYIKPGEAMGLSFSVPRGVTIPASLRNIYNCLEHHGLTRSRPTHGDLTSWAEQGVLLLNTALTTRVGVSNDHASAWSAYTDAVIKNLSDLPQQLVFVLLGVPAQKKAALVDTRRHVILSWGHPSPLNAANQSDNPKNFKYCNLFSRVNDHLVLQEKKQIVWHPDGTEAPKPPSNTRAVPPGDFWIFTDGGATGNGRAHCVASYAYYATDGVRAHKESGIVPECNIDGVKYKSSNNRGELTALLHAMKFACGLDLSEYKRICVVTDSEYSKNSITVWLKKWLDNPVKYNLSQKKNLDLLIPIRELVDKLESHTRVEFSHTNSHMAAPADRESLEWFIWNGNDIADKLCDAELKQYRP